MKNQYSKIVFLDERGRTFEFQAKKGMTLEAIEETHGKLFIRAIDLLKQNYTNPPIPDGWEYVSGEWNKGIVIERKSDNSQFVWIPVGSLPYNGMLKGKEFDSQFGRRDYSVKNLFEREYREKFEGKLELQSESIEKYGGFYISRYEISMQGSHVQSLKNKKPITNISFYDAMTLANGFENSKDVKSHLPFGAEYDSVLTWFLKSEAKKYHEIAEDSTNWGNFANSNSAIRAVLETGSNEAYRVNEIYDLAGNLDEWTQEKYNEQFRVTRSGHFGLDGHFYPVCYRNFREPSKGCIFTGFRISLYIK